MNRHIGRFKYALVFPLMLLPLQAKAQNAPAFPIHFTVPSVDRMAISNPDYRINKISVKYAMKGVEYNICDVTNNKTGDKMRVEVNFDVPLGKFADIEVWAVAYNAKGAELNRTGKAKVRVYNPIPEKHGEIMLTFQKQYI